MCTIYNSTQFFEYAHSPRRLSSFVGMTSDICHNKMGGGKYEDLKGMGGGGNRVKAVVWYRVHFLHCS